MEHFLGKDGAKALKKAAQKIPDLETLIVPTVFNSWLGKISSYEGALLGKNVKLDLDIDGFWNGKIEFNKELSLDLNKSETSYVVATLAVVYGLQDSIGQFKPKSLDGLNKTIDSLVGYNLAKSFITGGKNVSALPRVQIKPVVAVPPNRKAPSATSLADGMVAPPSPTPGMPNMAASGNVIPLPKLNIPKMRLAKSEIQDRCGICGINQFQNGDLRGCLCIRGAWKYLEKTWINEDLMIENKINLPNTEIMFIVNVLKGI